MRLLGMDTCPSLNDIMEIRCNTGADPGGGTRRTPPKIGKNMIVWGKIVIFHTKYLKICRASIRNWEKYDFLA